MRYREVVSYLIDNWSIAVAEKFIDTVDRKLDLLTNFPEIGQRTKGNSKIRRLVLNKQITLIYEPQRHKILVLDIHDNRQKDNWMAKEWFFKHKFIKEGEDYTPASEYEILLNKGHLMIHMYSLWDGLKDSIKFKVIEGTFISELREREIYEVAELLDFHFKYYVTNGGESQKMIKYLRSLFEEVKEGNLYPYNPIMIGGNSSETQEEAAERSKKLKSRRIEEGLKWCDSKELLFESSDTNKELNGLNHPQKVLLTYYFQEYLNFPRKEGLNMNDEPYNKFLSYLFSYDWKNTQRYFNSIGRNTQHNPKNVNNLQKVIEIFQGLRLDEYIPRIEEDLRRVQGKNKKKE